MKIVWRIYLMLTLTLMTVCAQDQGASKKPVLPEGPLINPVPNLFKWTLTRRDISNGQKTPQDKSGGGLIELTVGLKVGDVISLVSTSGNGEKTEIWIKGRIRTMLNTAWEKPLVTDQPEDYTFGGFAWISAANFQGIETQGGRKCLVFRDRIFEDGGTYTKEDLDGVDPETLKVTVSAVIDLEKRLPVSLQVGTTTTTFEFEQLPPGTQLELPEKVRTAIAEKQTKISAMLRKPVRP